MARTIIEKIWEEHVVHREEGYPDMFYIDLHLVHEVTSPQAFSMLRETGRGVFRPARTWGTEDHNIPTKDQHLPIKDAMGRMQVAKLRENCNEF